MHKIYQDTILSVHRAIGRKPTQVLIADDEETFRRILTMYFSEEGYTVFEAGNGEEALRIFKEQNSIDLVILDFDMPVLNGAEVVRRIRKTNLKTPIIVLTGYVTDAEAIINSGWATIIGKPIQLDVLDGAVQSHLIKQG